MTRQGLETLLPLASVTSRTLYPSRSRTDTVLTKSAGTSFSVCFFRRRARAGLLLADTRCSLNRRCWEPRRPAGWERGGWLSESYREGLCAIPGERAEPEQLAPGPCSGPPGHYLRVCAMHPCPPPLTTVILGVQGFPTAQKGVEEKCPVIDSQTRAAWFRLRTRGQVRAKCGHCDELHQFHIGHVAKTAVIRVNSSHLEKMNN